MSAFNKAWLVLKLLPGKRYETCERCEATLQPSDVDSIMCNRCIQEEEIRNRTMHEEARL